MNSYWILISGTPSARAAKSPDMFFGTPTTSSPDDVIDAFDVILKNQQNNKNAVVKKGKSATKKEDVSSDLKTFYLPLYQWFHSLVYVKLGLHHNGSKLTDLNLRTTNVSTNVKKTLTYYIIRDLTLLMVMLYFSITRQPLYKGASDILRKWRKVTRWGLLLSLSTLKLLLRSVLTNCCYLSIVSHSKFHWIHQICYVSLLKCSRRKIS